MSKSPATSRRRFFKRLGLYGAAAALAAGTDAVFLEPHWLKIRHLRLANGTPTARFAYFTDLHYKGDRKFVESVVRTINAESPDFVCFGGDLIEEGRHLNEALELMSGIKAPLYGVPGNHDFWSRVSFEPYRQCFAATGGAWLMDEHRDLADGRLRLIGLACRWTDSAPLPVKPGAKNVLLMHYPAWFEKVSGPACDLMLAGHSHGGQVRLPFIGSIIVPFNVNGYDMGLFQTKLGPLYVNPGIGWFYLDVRFNCRPELTVIEV